jgi:hypothetical protein
VEKEFFGIALLSGGLESVNGVVAISSIEG